MLLESFLNTEERLQRRYLGNLLKDPIIITNEIIESVQNEIREEKEKRKLNIYKEFYKGYK